MTPRDPYAQFDTLNGLFMRALLETDAVGRLHAAHAQRPDADTDAVIHGNQLAFMHGQMQRQVEKLHQLKLAAYDKARYDALLPLEAIVGARKTLATVESLRQQAVAHDASYVTVRASRRARLHRRLVRGK